MAGVPIHVCPELNELGNPIDPELVTCGNCNRAWCWRCDPAPAALCHWCHGRGYSVAPVPPRQARALRRH